MAGWNYSSVEVNVQIAPDDTLFAASPTWTGIGDDVRSLSFTRSGRTNELDQTQPGTLELTVSNLTRKYDPTYGPASVTFDGTANNYYSTPDPAAIAGSTQLDIKFAVSLTDWTPATDMTIVSQYGGAGTRAFRLYVAATTGLLTLVISSDGTATTDATSQVQFCAVDGQAVCGRVKRSLNSCEFFIKRVPVDRLVEEAKSNDGWVSVGFDSSISSSALFDSSSTARVGILANGNDPLTGRIYYCSVATTFDAAADFAFTPAALTAVSSTSFVSNESGETWTGTGSAYVNRIQGTYYGRLLPGTPIRVRANYSAANSTLWYGYVRRVTLSYPGGGKDAVARIQAVDALGWLADMKAPETPYGIGLATLGFQPSSYWPLHEPVGSRQFSDVYGESHGEWSGLGTAGANAQPASQAPTRGLELTAVYANAIPPVEDLDIAGGELVELGFFVYTADTTNVWRVFIADDGGVDLGINYGNNGLYYVVTPSGVSYTFDERVGVGWHFVYLIFNSSTLVAGAIGNTTLTLTGTTTSPTIESGLFIQGDEGVTISDVSYGIYNSVTPTLGDAGLVGSTGRYGDTGGERVEWLLTAAGVPAGLQDISTDSASYLGATGAGGTYGDLLKQANSAEAGRLFVAADGDVTFRSRVWNLTATEATTSQGTFTDTYVDVTIDPASIDDVINNCTVTLSNGSTGNYRDDVSIALYGDQPTSITAPCASPEDAQSLAQYVVGLRNHPHTRITSVSFKPRHPTHAATLIPHALARTNGDRITIVRNPKPTGSEPITAQLQIETVSHAFGVNGEWMVTWLTSPAPLTAAEAGYFTLDDANLGLLDTAISFAP